VILLAFCGLANEDCNSYVVFMFLCRLKEFFDALAAI